MQQEEFEKFFNFSWDIESLSSEDQWFRSARAYLDCSIFILSGFFEKRIPLNFFYAEVAAYLVDHGVELFLKAGIVHAGQIPQSNHQLDNLYQEFRELYSESDFDFKSEIASLVKQEPKRPFGTFSGYPLDRNLKSMEGQIHFDIRIWRDQLLLISQDFNRLEPLIMSRVQPRDEPKPDPVDLAGELSFPASDPPAWSY